MRNYSIYTLKTKPEFTNLYQYLSEKDYKQLEQQILCHSYHTPICTWNGIVINGIEAYELFRKHSIPFRIKRLHFSSKEDVISWICTVHTCIRSVCSSSEYVLSYCQDSG